MKIHAPQVGRAWRNTAALTMHELRGRVVLAGFWDYACSNCLRTLPCLKEWRRRSPLIPRQAGRTDTTDTMESLL